jgi:hypothetical protein
MFEPAGRYRYASSPTSVAACVSVSQPDDSTLSLAPFATDRRRVLDFNPDLRALIVAALDRLRDPVE